MTPALSLIIYVGVLTVLSFFILSILKQAHITSSPLVAALNVLILLWLVLNPRIFELWLALLLMIINITVIAWMIYQEPSAVMKKQVLAVIGPFVVATMLLLWHNYINNLNGVTVRVMLSTETEAVNPFIDARLSAMWESNIAKEFEKETGIIVEIVPASYTVDERLTKYLEQLQKPSGKEGTEDTDVYAIDVIWPGILAQYAEDLTPAFRKLEGFHSAIVANNTVDGKLVAVPWYTDVGLLFYRKSLLKRYNYDNPPETWDDLQEMAMKIQEGERAQVGNNFWGFVWQGTAYEGLTCNALEWQVSQGGGFIVDEANKNVSLDDDSAIAAFERARGWIGTISPPEVLKHKEAHTFDWWQQGKAAFMRNWPYAYAASQALSSAFKDDVGVALLPKGSGNNARHPSVLGGWQLMVNKASNSKGKKAAIQFIRFMTRFDTQKSLAMNNGKLPALKTVYIDPEIQHKLLPFIGNPSLKDLIMGDSEALVARPSTPTGVKYRDISTAYHTTVHKILQGQGARPLVERLEHDLQTLQSQHTP